MFSASGTLVVARRRRLRECDSLGLPVTFEPTAEPSRIHDFSCKARVAVDAAGQRVAAQRRQLVRQAAVDRRQHEAEARSRRRSPSCRARRSSSSSARPACRPDTAPVTKRACSAAVSASSTPIDQPPGSLPVSLAAPRIVVSDGDVDEVGVGRSLRRAADAARVEKARREEEVEVARRGRVAEAEDVQPFGEERPLLRIERLELAEVDDGRIDFDLAEVGIDRAGQREARRQRVLQIESRRRRGSRGSGAADCWGPRA